jgi:DNA-binding protein H-NS
VSGDKSSSQQQQQSIPQRSQQQQSYGSLRDFIQQPDIDTDETFSSFSSQEQQKTRSGGGIALTRGRRHHRPLRNSTLDP